MTSRVATYNVGSGAARKKDADLNRLAALGVTRIGLQEASDRGSVIAHFLDHHKTWRAWAPRMPGAKAVPILYDTAVWKLHRTRTVIAVARRFVGAGAGPSWSKAKAINVVVLVNRKTGVRVRHLNTHFIASAERSPAVNFRLRRNHYLAHARVLARVIGKGARMRETEVTGDFNAEPDSPLLAPVRATGITGWTHEATHGTRRIDHVLGGGGGRTTVHLSSDHLAVITTP